MVIKFALILTLAVTLMACSPRLPIDVSAAVCDGLSQPLDRHLDALVANGEGILQAGAGEALVTATELAGAYDGACRT